ncbi:MAG: hypothetical protein Q4A78_12570 [Peptostreptococcaceae bacterium]|nr:hypothetical protein [Peptostreptococcaceae bacterium]
MIYEGTDPKIVKVPGGTKLLFTAEGLGEDRSITKWSVNGEDHPSLGNSYEFFVNKNATIVAHFGAFEGYTLSIPQEALSAADIETAASPELLNNGKIAKNAKLTFTITPKEGYLIDKDGIRLLQGTFDSIKEQDGSWIAEIEQVRGDVTLQLHADRRLQIFMRENGTDALPGAGADSLKYTGGSVQLSVEGKELQRTIAGDTVNLSVFSESRYRLESIKVYGKTTAAEIPLAQSGSGYTFTAPKEDVAIEAKFLYIYVPPTPSPSPSPSPNPPEDKPKEEVIDLPKAIDDSEQIEEKTTADPSKEWIVTLNLNLSGLDEKEVFLLDENGKVQEATVQINIHAPNQFILRPKEAYAEGKRYYIYIRKDGLLSENGGKLRRDVLFSFIYQK